MIKQYVNLDPDPDEPHHGPELRLTAEAASIGADDSVRSEWWFEPQTQNHNQRFLARNKRAHFLQNYPVNEDNAFHNTFFLPHVGGDSYDVSCSKRHDRSQSHSFETIETWRKLYFSVWYMNDACLSLFDQTHALVEGELQRCFVELEEVARAQTLLDEPATTYRNGLVHLFAHPTNPDPTFLEHRPFHLRIVLINKLYNPSSHSYTGSCTESTLTQNTIDTLPAEDWLRSGQIKLNRHGQSWQNINESSEMVTRVSDTQFQIDVSSLPDYWAEGEYDGSWQYRLNTNELNDLAGGNIGNLSIVTRGDESGNYTVQQSSLIQVHEMGHSCGQVVRRERTYNSNGSATGWENHPSWYDDAHGGLGNHCSHHAHLVPDSNVSSGQTYVPDRGQTVCVMYHRINPQHGMHYCPNCLSRTQRADLGRAAMIQRRWNRF